MSRVGSAREAGGAPPRAACAPPGSASERAFLGAAAALLAASSALALAWCASMSAMDGMAMPGGWTLSMAWLRMPGQSWPGAAASFLGMWIAMMVAMMLPALVPMLLRYRRAVSHAVGPARLGRLTARVALGYYAVWSALGAVVFPLGAALAALELQQPALARAVPLAAAATVLGAGALQLSPWKAHQLACCREVPARASALPADVRTAYRHGLQLGLRCCSCCAGPTAVLFALGVMDPRAMVLVTAAISAERLAPQGARVARCIGIAGVAIGLGLLARAAGLA